MFPVFGFIELWYFLVFLQLFIKFNLHDWGWVGEDYWRLDSNWSYRFCHGCCINNWCLCTERFWWNYFSGRLLSCSKGSIMSIYSIWCLSSARTMWHIMFLLGWCCVHCCRKWEIKLIISSTLKPVRERVGVPDGDFVGSVVCGAMHTCFSHMWWLLWFPDFGFQEFGSACYSKKTVEHVSERCFLFIFGRLVLYLFIAWSSYFRNIFLYCSLCGRVMLAACVKDGEITPPWAFFIWLGRWYQVARCILLGIAFWLWCGGYQFPWSL